MYLRLASPLFILAACAGAPETPMTDATRANPERLARFMVRTVPAMVAVSGEDM